LIWPGAAGPRADPGPLLPRDCLRPAASSAGVPL